MRRGLFAVFALAALACAAAALADREQISFTAADQAAAKKAVVHKTDLNTSGWKGGYIKPDLSPEPTCANYDPKQSDLVVTGAAETVFQHPGLKIDTEAEVLQTARMVALDWQRTVLDPHAISCLQETLAKNLAQPGKIKLSSFRQIPFPKVGTYSRAFLTVIVVTTAHGQVPVTLEDVLIGKGRTEITISTTAAAAGQPEVAAANVRLARLLVTRAT